MRREVTAWSHPAFLSLNPSKWIVVTVIDNGQPIKLIESGPVLRNMKLVILLNSHTKVIYSLILWVRSLVEPDKQYENSIDLSMRGERLYT